MTKPPPGWTPRSDTVPTPLPLPEVLPREWCDVCGCMIGNQVTHDAWHADHPNLG